MAPRPPGILAMAVEPFVVERARTVSFDARGGYAGGDELPMQTFDEIGLRMARPAGTHDVVT